jgi:hypothetical protein
MKPKRAKENKLSKKKLAELYIHSLFFTGDRLRKFESMCRVPPGTFSRASDKIRQGEILPFISARAFELDAN